MPAIIHVCGLGWSGSGALIDALHDSGRVAGLSGGYADETALFRPNNRLSPVQFMTLFTQRQRIDQCGFLSLITGGRLGTEASLYRDELEYFYGQNPMTRAPYNSQNFAGIAGKALRDEIDALFDGQATIGADDFLRRYAGWANRLVDFVREQSGKTIVLNNDPISRHLERIPVRRENRAIVIVVRTPEDMIADNPRIRQKPKRGLLRAPARWLTVARLAWMKRGKLRRCRALYDQSAHDLHLVRFERFVADADYRERLLADLLESAPGAPPERRFRPGDSAANIGIGRRTLGGFERALVALLCGRAFRQLLHRADTVARRQ